MFKLKYGLIIVSAVIWTLIGGFAVYLYFTEDGMTLLSRLVGTNRLEILFFRLSIFVGKFVAGLTLLTGLFYTYLMMGYREHSRRNPLAYLLNTGIFIFILMYWSSFVRALNFLLFPNGMIPMNIARVLLGVLFVLTVATVSLGVKDYNDAPQR